MKKGNFEYKVKKVLKDDGRIIWLLYRDTVTPLVICWCHGRTMAYDIAKVLNQNNNDRFKLEGQ